MTGEDEVATQHTVYKQKVTYDSKGDVKKVEGVGSEQCNCGDDHDHTVTSETVFE